MKNGVGTIFLVPFSFFGLDKSKGSSKDANKTGKVVHKNISPKQAKAIMDEGGPYKLVDVRTREEFRDSHIKGAVLIPVDEIASRAEAQLTDKNAVILVYCASGARSTRASKILADMGYINVNNFGGIMNWPYDTVSG